MTRIGSLCTGYVGLDMAVEAVLGGSVAWVADNDPGATAILAHHFPDVPNLGDISVTDWTTVEPVGVLTAGFPCFGEGTRILTETGWRSIETVKVGDFVLTHTGRWMPVTSTMSRVSDHRVTLHGHGLPRVVTTEEHPFYARTARQEWVGRQAGSWRRTFSDPQWVDAAKMAGQFAGQVLPPVEDGKHGPDLWWVVGRYLADGWTTSGGGRKHNRVVICCAHEEADELEERLNAVVHATRSEELTSTKFHITRAWFVDFVSFLGRGAAGKTLTRRELALPEEKAKALLDGWLSGDGCRMKQTTETGWQATTVSRSLALSMALLAQRAYGVVARVYETAVSPRTTITGREVGQRTQYKVSVPDRNRSAVVDGDYGWKLVRKAIRTDGPTLVYNLSVAQDESYIADGAIVHNCQDVSCAGGRAGLRSGNRTGVWAYVARAIDTLRPSLVVLENVRGLLSFGADSDLEWCPWCLGNSDPESALRAIGAVLGDLADLGFDADWTLVSAADIGAPHRRERVFITAWPAADTTPAIEGRRDCTGSGARRHAPLGHEAGAESCDGRGSPAQDADRPVGGERWVAASGQAPGGWPRADAGGPDRAPVAADTERDGQPGWPACAAGEADEPREGPRPAAEGRGASDGGGTTPADPGRTRLSQHPGEPSEEEAGPHPGDELAGDRGLRPAPNWGPYEPAIRQWESITGRPAPHPTEPGRTGERLSPAFVEWMMGLPEGWVTDVPGLTRNAQLKALGNGVVPQQAAEALRMLLPAVMERAA